MYSVETITGHTITARTKKIAMESLKNRDNFCNCIYCYGCFNLGYSEMGDCHDCAEGNCQGY